MARVLQAKGLAGKCVHLGYASRLTDELVSDLRDGSITALCVLGSRKIGATAVETAALMANGKTVAEKIAVPATFVTKDNVDTPECADLR